MLGTLSPQIQDILDSGRFHTRCVAEVQTANAGAFRIWDDVGDISIDGETYHGAAGRFTVESASSSMDFAIENAIVKLNGLDDVNVAMIHDAHWHQQPAAIKRLVISADDPSVIGVIPDFIGFADTMEWPETPGQASEMSLNCETIAREYNRSGSSSASDADQRARDAEDGFFSFAVSALTVTTEWGSTSGTASG